jgi:hypothetical protein
MLIYYNFYGEPYNTRNAGFTMTVLVDGQDCGSQELTPVGRQWVRATGSNTFLLENDNPVVSVLVTVVNPTTAQVEWTLDDVRITKIADSALSACS